MLQFQRSFLNTKNNTQVRWCVTCQIHSSQFCSNIEVICCTLGPEKPSKGRQKAVVLSERKSEREASVKDVSCLWKKRKRKKRLLFCLTVYLVSFLVSRGSNLLLKRLELRVGINHANDQACNGLCVCAHADPHYCICQPQAHESLQLIKMPLACRL